VRSEPGAARTILLFHIISARPSKQPLMVRTFLKVYMELDSYVLFLQEQIKDIIIWNRAALVAAMTADVQALQIQRDIALERS
jgi:GTPase involved in cell partitioning and DNA repair